MPKQTRKQPRRHRRKTHKQRGGRFVSLGGHGCGFRPALRCAGEAARRPGKFAKLESAKAAAEEMAFRDLLYPLDPLKEFFLYPDAVCDPAPYEASDEFDKCELQFSGAPRVIIMSKGGDDLGRLNLRPREYLPFLQSLRNILRGISVLHAAGLAHMDIKPANIVCRRHHNGSLQTRLIDFGLMVNPATLDAQAANPQSVFRNHNVHLANYMYWPFDVRLSYPGMIREAQEEGSYQIESHLENFYDEVGQKRDSIPVRAILHNKLYTDTVADIADYYDTAPDNVTLYRRIFFPADIYSLGITFAQIWYRFFGHRDNGAAAPDIVVRNAPAGLFVRVNALAVNAHLNAEAIAWHQGLLGAGSFLLYSLVRRMINPNPVARPNIAEVTATFEAILVSITPLLTAARIGAAVKPWMLDRNVLVEASPVAVGGAGAAAAAASSSSEREAPAAVAEVPAGPVVVPEAAAANMPSASTSSEKIPSEFAVSSSTRASSKTNSSGSRSNENYNSEEERRAYENFINSQFNGGRW